MAGMSGFPFGGAYNATKLAVAGLSEGWAMELAPFGIQVAALCPAFVKTRIHLSDRVRPEDYGDAQRTLLRSEEDLDPETASTGIANAVKNGIDPDVLALRVVESLRAGDIYIFTHPSYSEVSKQRYSMIDQCFDNAAKSPIVGNIESAPLDPDLFK
jgi:NAD(P)-dependent dehydrogenase (short-subunit alcohol dehydrogenase family)